MGQRRRVPVPRHGDPDPAGRDRRRCDHDDRGRGATPGEHRDDPPAATIPDAGDNCGAGEHTVEAGDIRSRVAEKYDVTVEALNAANANNPAYSQFIPGPDIIIPGKADC